MYLEAVNKLTLGGRSLFLEWGLKIWEGIKVIKNPLMRQIREHGGDNNQLYQ